MWIKLQRLERRNKLLLVAPVVLVNIVLSKRNQEESQLTIVNFVLVVTYMENALFMVSVVVRVTAKIILQSVAGRQLTKFKNEQDSYSDTSDDSDFYIGSVEVTHTDPEVVSEQPVEKPLQINALDDD